MTIEQQRETTYKQYTAAQNEMQELNTSIKDLQLNMERASDGMKSRYEEVLKSKQGALDMVKVTAGRLYDRLEYLNSPEAVVEAGGETVPDDFPYANIRRSLIDDEQKAKIIKEFGRAAYLSMPL